MVLTNDYQYYILYTITLGNSLNTNNIKHSQVNTPQPNFMTSNLLFKHKRKKVSNKSYALSKGHIKEKPVSLDALFWNGQGYLVFLMNSQTGDEFKDVQLSNQGQRQLPWTYHSSRLWQNNQSSPTSGLHQTFNILQHQLKWDINVNQHCLQTICT